MTGILIQLVTFIFRTLVLILFVYVILSWVLPPYHQFRQALSRLVDPMLNPIRRLMPRTGPFDFSVIVLFILLQLLETLLVQTLRSF